jgi:hypothetical protein
MLSDASQPLSQTPMQRGRGLSRVAVLLLCVAGAYLWGRHDGSAAVGAADVAPSTVGGLSSTATNALRRFRGGGNDAGASQSGEKLTLKEVETTMGEWIKNAQNLDIDATVAMYDPEIGRLLGTVDLANAPRRTSLKLIRDYFNHFLGDNEVVTPHFPKFDKKDVIFLADDVVSYSGYYTFTLTPKGGQQTKEVHAKFTYILRKTPNGVKIVTHNSGITPAGVVMKE